MNKRKKIELVIDDAGSGNIVGGIMISGYSAELDDYKSSVIKPDLYNKTFDDIQVEIYNCVKEIVDYFSEHYIQNIFLCQSNLFDYSTMKLIEQDYVVIRGKVEGKLQDLIEIDFIKHLKSFGMPDYIDFFFKVIKKDKNAGYKMLNNFCINFVKADLENRLKYCKMNSKLYDDLKNSDVTKVVVDNKSQKKYKLCCNCGKYIKTDKMYKYITPGRSNLFYTHIDCED
jgi:hypothetical protein